MLSGPIHGGWKVPLEFVGASVVHVDVVLGKTPYLARRLAMYLLLTMRAEQSTMF